MSGQAMDASLQSDSVTGIVLAGGASRRMGRNKALLPMGGVSLIERTVRALGKVSRRVIISTNEPESFRFLGVECVPDFYAGKGPMAGLHAALRASNSTWNVVAACDMPYIHEQFLHGLLNLVNVQGTAEAVIPVVQGRIHPLLAVYRREVVTSLERKLQAEQLRMVEWVQELQAVYVNEERLEAVTSLDPQKVLFNMNTPDDYEAASGRRDSGNAGE